MARDPFNQNSDRSDREKRTTSKGGPVFSKLFRLDQADPLSFGPKFGKEHFFYKTCNWEVSGSFTSCMVVQNKGKEMYNKVCCTCITLDSVKFFAFCGVRQQARAKFYFSFDLGYGPLKVSFKKVRVHLSK